MLEYRTPRSITVSDEVNIRKNDGIIRMLTTMATHPVDCRENHSMDGCGVRLLFRPGSQVKGDHRIDSHSESDGRRVDQVLHRIHQGQGPSWHPR